MLEWVQVMYLPSYISQEGCEEVDVIGTGYLTNYIHLFNFHSLESHCLHTHTKLVNVNTSLGRRGCLRPAILVHFTLIIYIHLLHLFKRDIICRSFEIYCVMGRFHIYQLGSTRFLTLPKEAGKEVDVSNSFD